MARVTFALGLTMVVISTMWLKSPAQTCMPALVSLTPCMSFLNGSLTSPSDMCCTQLTAITQSQAVVCLCTVLNFGVNQILGVPISQSQAITLPGACNLQIPPLSQCDAVSNTPTTTPSTSVTTTTASPEASPAPVSSDDVPAVPTALSPSAVSDPSVTNIPTGSGKTTPTTAASSAWLSHKPSCSSLLFFLLVAVYASSSFSA